MPIFDQTNDETMLRRAFAVARAARDGGNPAYGAVLVGPDGAVLMEQGNTYAEGKDLTAHAERILATRASRRWRPDFLARCTLFASAEPCAMCAGAIYWVGIGRVVFGQSEASLSQQGGDSEENPTLPLPCRTVFAAGKRQVEVRGPLLEEEAAALQPGFGSGSER